MSVIAVVLVVLLILAVFSAPNWPYAQGWGWYPSGGLGTVLIVLLLLYLLGVLR